MFVNARTRAALKMGMPVQVIGANLQVRGRNYFLARQIVAEGHIFTIRDKRGMPVFQLSGKRIVRVSKPAAGQQKGASR
jgi:primosomal replication protein N